MNSYLAMAAALASGLDGITRRLAPPEPVTNAEKEGIARRLPSNLLKPGSERVTRILHHEFFSGLPIPGGGRGLPPLATPVKALCIYELTGNPGVSVFDTDSCLTPISLTPISSGRSGAR